MFLLLSGEGASDIGTQDNEIGPMTKFVDIWVEQHIGYSLIDIKQYRIVTEQALSEVAKVAKKEQKSKSQTGKKNPRETRLFYKNARALARLANRESTERNLPVIVVLFRDADGTNRSKRGEWQDKVQSMLKGFEKENILYGVPMIPKPKSEAWILCGLRNNYQNCQQLENESGNDHSPNPLKQQLEQHLGERATRVLLNDKIDEGLLDIRRIVDMPSLTAFKKRLDEVLDLIYYKPKPKN
jgi:hypothetical protein